MTYLIIACNESVAFYAEATNRSVGLAVVIAVVVYYFAATAHILDTTILVYYDVVMGLNPGHTSREDVGRPITVSVPIHGLTANEAVAAIVIRIGHDKLLLESGKD